MVWKFEAAALHKNRLATARLKSDDSEGRAMREALVYSCLCGKAARGFVVEKAKAPVVETQRRVLDEIGVWGENCHDAACMRVFAVPGFEMPFCAYRRGEQRIVR
ncbi:MAG: hypothetical protein RMM53_04730 [Bacteroidia bacterium]|nr:hypothetical protein [Bacteroidia bacterium]